MSGKIDGKRLQLAMLQVPSAVTVVTAAGADEMGGLTVRSFTSVSLDPLLISLNVAHTAQAHDLLVGVEHFAVHLLSDEQTLLSDHFAAPDRSGAEQFAALPYHRNAHGTPILEDVLAIFHCAHHAAYDAGDHTLLLGTVLHIEKGVEGRPLVYFDHSYRRVGGPINAKPPPR